MAMGFNILLFMVVVSIFIQFMGPAAGIPTRSIALEFLSGEGKLNTNNPIFYALGVMVGVAIGLPILLAALNILLNMTGLSTLSYNFPNPYTWFMGLAGVMLAWLVIYPYELFTQVDKAGNPLLPSFLSFFIIGVLTFALFWAILDWYKQVQF